MPKNGSLQGVRFYIGYVAVAGAYIDYSQVSIHFELRRITNTASVHIHTLTAITNGLSDKIGSYGIFPPNPVQVGGGVSGLNTQLTAGYLYGIKFIHDTTGSPVIASAVRNVILRLNLRKPYTNNFATERITYTNFTLKIVIKIIECCAECQIIH